jgi:Protein of unknown function (DUF3987)
LPGEVTECLPKESWFTDWMKVWPLAEPPRSYILFSGMACLGAALGRRVYFSLDVHKVYPLLNLLLIGPSGIGKSTAMRDIAVNHLIPQLPEELKPNLLTGKSTKEAIHQDLVVAPKSIILASELANLFSKEKYNEGMIPYFTDLLDLAPARVRTKSGGNMVIQRPECCVMGGSTKQWLQDMLPNTAGEGGFLPRFLIVKEDYKFQRIADPRRHMNDAQRAELAAAREKVVYDFVRLVRINEGLIDFDDYEASDVYTSWYNTLVPESGSLSPFAARAGAHVLRLALLIAISCSRQVIAGDDVRAAICLYTYATQRLGEVVIPMSPEGKKVTKLMEAIGNLALSATEIRRAMRNYMGSADVDRMLGDLVRDKELICEDTLYRRPMA